MAVDKLQVRQIIAALAIPSSRSGFESGGWKHGEKIVGV